MDTKLWGRGFWLVIWIILFDERTFPDLTEVKEYLDLINRNLPCDECKQHIAKSSQEANIMSASNRNQIRKFYADIYNKTNTSGKVLHFACGL